MPREETQAQGVNPDGQQCVGGRKHDGRWCTGGGGEKHGDWWHAGGEEEARRPTVSREEIRARGAKPNDQQHAGGGSTATNGAREERGEARQLAVGRKIWENERRQGLGRETKRWG